jgi:hypothetical protein
VTATSLTFDQIDALPFPQVLAQCEYWADNPPAHLLLKAYVGYKPTKSRDVNRWEREALPPPNAALPPPPPYVLAAMKAHKSERANA